MTPQEIEEGLWKYAPVDKLSEEALRSAVIYLRRRLKEAQDKIDVANRVEREIEEIYIIGLKMQASR